MTFAIAINGKASAKPQIPNTTPSRIWNANKRGRRNLERLTLDDRRENVAFQRVNAEKQRERAGRGDPSRREAREHHDQAGDQRADRRNEGKQSGLDAQNERTLDADDRKPDPGHEEHRGHGDDLRDQPALQRFADAVDDHGCAGAMPRRRHEQQSLSVDARLRREGQPEKQHEKRNFRRRSPCPEAISGSG